MSSARAAFSSASKTPNKVEKSSSSKVARKHLQPTTTKEYRDIGSTNIPEGSEKTKNLDGNDKKAKSALPHSSLQRRAPPQRRQRRRPSTLRKLITRCTFIYLLYVTFWQCPSYTNKNGALQPDSPVICAGINEVKTDIRYIFGHPLYKQHVGQHIDPYLNQVQHHYDQHVAPLLSTSKYYGSKYGIPAAQKANALYNQHVHPIYLQAHDYGKKQYDVHVKHHVDRYYSEAEQHYRKHLGPHVDYATTTAQKLQADALKFHKDKVVPFNAQAAKHLQKTYDTTKPVVEKAVAQSIEFYHNKFQPAFLAAVDTLWHLTKEISYKVKVISVDAADKAYIWSKDVYQNHAQPYYQKKVAPFATQKYQQYLEPSVNDAKKFIFAHIDEELVKQTWDTAKMNGEIAYRFVKKHTLVATAITTDFLKQQREKYEAYRAKAAEGVKSARYEAVASASSAAAQITKKMTKQESGIKAAGAQATDAAGEIKDKAKGAVHHFATEAANMVRNAQNKVYDAAGNVYSHAMDGSNAAVSQFEKAKQVVASGLHHGTSDVSSKTAEGTSKITLVADSGSSIASSVSHEPAITPEAVITSSRMSASQTTADTSSQPSITAEPTNSSDNFNEDHQAHVTDGKGAPKQETKDSAQTIAAPFRDATKANTDNVSAERVKASPINDSKQAIVELPNKDIAEELPIISDESDQKEEVDVQGKVPVAIANDESGDDAHDNPVVQGRVPIPVEESNHVESTNESENQRAGPVVPELPPKGDGDLSKLPPNEMREHFDENEFKQAPIRSEEKGYLDSIVTDQIEEIIKSANIIRTELEAKYDDIEKAALESIQHTADVVEEESKSLVYHVVQKFQDFYQAESADSTKSNEEKLKAIEDKYNITRKVLLDVLEDQRSISSESARQAKASITAAQKHAEGQIRQRFKEGLHRLRSGTQEVSGLNDRLRRELTTKLEDAQVQALKTVHSAEKVVAVEQKLLNAHTHRLTSKIDRLEATAMGEMNKWLQQAQQVFSIQEPWIDLESSNVEADFEGFEIEHQPVPEETSPAGLDYDEKENVTPVEPVAEHVQKDLHHQQILDEHIRKAQERAARVAKTVEDWVEAAKRKSARTEAPSL
ncbi:hypothetical protein BGW37DRAFT_484719 [Umbelopsis sp. PMI_123]|nr:hypothetical protein BGW37DRAFT_484719 [Umbelopsis sp. PMI_123]